MDGNSAGSPAGNGAPPAPANGKSPFGDLRLKLVPHTGHNPERYDDVASELEPALFSALERHLPPSLLEVSRDVKLQFMSDVVSRYLSAGERNRVQRQKDYRQKLLSIYEPLHKQLYSLQPSAFFVPLFLQAINDNTEESFRKIVSEPLPGVYTFPILQPSFCELLLDELKNIEKCVTENKFKLMKPNTMNKHGAVLDDFGLEAMLNKFVEDFISPLSRVFYPEVGGATLDSHHGFVVEYGQDKDNELGFHVDDSEVTLNICLGKEFSGGELFFRGVRCDQHVNSEAQPEEVFDYFHVPGQAVLHRGRHRHGARATTSGHRINMLLWCRSSIFREMKKYQKEFSSWCGECQREKRERQRQSVAASKLAFIRTGTGSVH